MDTDASASVRSLASGRSSSPSDTQVDIRGYLAAVDQLVRGAASHKHMTLEAILRAARGAFPSLVAERLRLIGLIDRLPHDPCRHDQSPPHYSPELHPLDYEWYFTRASSERVASLFSETAGVVLLLGTPTVSAELASRGRRSILIDRNPLVAQRFPEAIRRIDFRIEDLNRPLALTHPSFVSTRRRWWRSRRVYRRVAEPFEGVFFDGPWYPADMRQWLAQAANISSRRAIIGFALYPELLRPGADTERESLLDVARSLGEVEVFTDALQYDTPVFEREALAADGLSLTSNWRTADLVVIRKNRRAPQLKVTSTSGPSDDWETFVIGEQVVKLRNSTQGTSSVPLTAVPGLGGFVLPSVSRRDPRRSAIDLWTSRNRVAAVSDRQSVETALRSIAVYRGQMLFPASLGPIGDTLRLILQDDR